MDVLLVHPPRVFGSKRLEAAKTYRMPLGLLYTAAALEKEGFSVRVIDAFAERMTLDNVLDAVSRERPKVVGISATTLQTPAAVQLGKSLRGQDTVVCLGGPHVSADPLFIKRMPFFDFALAGEAEISFPRLVKDVLNGKTVKGVKAGLMVENLDSLPFPARHLLDYKNYLIEEHKYNFINLIANRGCPFNCVYCSSPVSRRRVRYRSPKSVVDEIEACTKERKVSLYMFEDDSLTLSRKQVFEMCNELKKRGLVRDWICETRIDLVDEALLKEMHEAGCAEISFGIESGNERIRNQIVKKNIKQADIYRVFKMCKNIGIKTDGYFMMGFPTETEKELEDTVQLCTSLDATIFGIHLTVPMPGAEIYRQAIEEGIMDKNHWDRYAKGEEKDVPVYVPKGITLAKIEEARKKAYRKFYFTPKFILKRLMHDLKSPHLLKRDFLLALSIYRFGKTATGRD